MSRKLHTLQQFAKIMSIAKYLCSASGVVSEIGNVVNESSASAVLECAPTGNRYWDEMI